MFSITCSEISLCQHFDHDVVDDDRVSREIERLQRFDRELDDEIQDLELVSWDGKLELEVEKAARMRSDIKMATQKLSCFQDEHRKIDDKLKVRMSRYAFCMIFHVRWIILNTNL